MEYSIFSLIDLTETGQHRGPDKKAVSQQANYDSVISLIGLRANPTPKRVIVHEADVKEMNFGTSFKGVHKYWEFCFEIEYGATDINFMIDDFNLVPVLTDLDETAKITVPVFDAKNSKTCNIFFRQSE